MKAKKKNIEYDFNRHIKIDEIVKLVIHLVKDKNYSYGFLLLVGSTLGYKVGSLLQMDWGKFVNKEGKCLMIIDDGISEERPVTKFLKSFIEFIYIKLNRPSLKSSPFIDIRNGQVLDTRNINRDLLKIQEEYKSIVGMPYPLETDTIRRVFGLSVWEKWHHQNAAIGVLRKHFGHNSDKMTREFLMIPQKLTIYKVTDIFRVYDKKINFEDLILD